MTLWEDQVTYIQHMQISLKIARSKTDLKEKKNSVKLTLIAM